MLAGRQHFASVGNRLKTDGPGGGSSGIHNRSPAESGLYYLNARYYDPEARRFVNVDEYGNLWELALAGGGTIAATWSVGGSNFWNPVGWVILGHGI